jgi:hypothetical protein
MKNITLLPNQQQCPNCGKVYTPVLNRQHPEIAIQKEFPNAPAWQREQHISAICSEKCWKEFLGDGGEE